MTDAVSALYVRADGPYPSLVADWWDGSPGRDARMYPGPNPVVAHPPCARWGNFWWAGRKVGRGLGEDDGCFRAALSAVQRWGGVLEHPSGSRAWPAFDLPRPSGGDWLEAPWLPDAPWTWRDMRTWVVEVEQWAHGHNADKSTWLLYVGNEPPEPLSYHPPSQCVLLDAPRIRGRRPVELMAKRERELTPEPFARLLVATASRCRAPEPA